MRLKWDMSTKIASRMPMLWAVPTANCSLVNLWTLPTVNCIIMWAVHVTEG